MKKNLYLACAFAALSMSASAQQNFAGTKFDDRIGHGEDSLAVRQNFSLYRDYFKQRSWADALEPWEFVFNKAPFSQVRIYPDGAIILEQLTQTETDEAKKQEYFDKLMKVYDQRLANLDGLNSFATPTTTSTKGNVLCRKAYDYYQFCPAKTKNLETAYNMFRSGIDDMGPNTEAFVLYGFIYCSYNRYMADKANDQKRTDFIRDYIECSEICDRLLEQAKEYPSETIPADPESEDSTKWVEQVVLAPEAQKIVDAYLPTQVQCNDLFVQSGAADCAALEKIYTSGVEEHKSDLEYLDAVLKTLEKFECDNSAIYFKASDYIYAIKPTPRAAIAKAKRLIESGNTDGAIKLAQEAVDMETDVNKKATYAYSVAAMYFKKGNASNARAWCKKAIQFKPSLGKAYLLEASCVARLAPAANGIERSKYFCLAYDKALKAKAVDPACAGQANKAAANYSMSFYPKSEAFFQGIKGGQAASVLGESTTLRLR